jgi:hypothetical protein
MRPVRSRATIRPARICVALALGLALAGCGRGGSHDAQELSFEQLSDTTGLAAGHPLLTTFEPYRLPGGSMRVRGALDLPDGARVQLTVERAASGVEVARMQFAIEGRRFETPPFMGERGPLPEDRYRFTLLAHFNDSWQPAAVMSATDAGRSLRGPGMTRTAMGQATFILHEERRL